MATTGRAARPTTQAAAHLPYAGLQLRIVAAILDAIVLVSFLMLFAAAGGILTLIQSDFGDTDPPESAFYVWAGFIIAFLPFAFLYFASMWSWRGQSVGMMAVHIKVVRRNGGRLSFRRSLARTLMWPLSVLPLGLGLVSALFDRQNRALHDLIAGTVVIELP